MSAFRPALVVLCLAACAMLALTGCGKSRIPDASPVPSAPRPAPSVHGHTAGPVPKATFRPYTVDGKRYHPLSSADGYRDSGLASWYGEPFHGRKTSNGETYNMYAMTCAHKILPMNTVVRVTNRNNGKSVVLRVNDRGPFVGTRIVDLSYAGAKQIGVLGPGTAPVTLEAVGMAGDSPRSVSQTMASARYFIQIGSFRNRDNAERLVRELEGRGFAQSRIQQADIDGATFWRVQAGAVAGMDRARQTHARLERQYPGSFLLTD
ncbi:rare lipoprotein A [Desulfobaculum xiamenense]|uniref:Probable endolytic peptidoglycan transglycosylase RlpA n=2 Tax=Desulfobaculum xiamenense TaxID=995050 RepID=A0A846QSE3_9BACT|nr:rare lipoprotein A [Desulfobaculum xiamenense]